MMISLTRAFKPRSINNISFRSVVYVRGNRVQGLIRDPQDILSNEGFKYSTSEENIGPLKQYLSKVTPNVQLSDDLLLQILTHKSFAHGSKPYNSRLAYFGEQLLQFTASKSVLAQTEKSVDTIGTTGFAAMGSLAHRLIWSDKFLAEFAQSKGIDKVFFCRKALPNGEQVDTYKPKKIFSTITTSLVGAIAATHGKKVAEEFITNEIIPAYQN